MNIDAIGSWSSKRKKRHLPARLFLCLMGWLALGGSTYVVPDDMPSIQAAIDSAASGDTVLVRAGTYYENLHTLEKVLTLKSLDGPEATIVDGGQQGSVIWITGDARVEGFTIRNGLNNHGGGIRVMGTAEAPVTVEILGNIITDNRAGYVVDQGIGGGCLLEWAKGSILECNVIGDNYAGDSGGGLYLGNGPGIRVKRNRIMRNGCHVGGGGISSGRTTDIAENLIVENWSDSFGGGIEGSASSIRNNTIVLNYINNTAFTQGAGLHLGGGSPVIQQNIIALNHGPTGRGTGVGIKCGTSSGTILIQCNDVWGNDRDYELYSGVDTTGLGNFSVDPKFCDLEGGNFELDATSACAPGNTACALVGAYPVGCAVPVRRTTWGKIKTLYNTGSGGNGGER